MVVMIKQKMSLVSYFHGSEYEQKWGLYHGDKQFFGDSYTFLVISVINN